MTIIRIQISCWLFICSNWSSSLLNSINRLRVGKRDLVKRYRKGMLDLRSILPKQMTILDLNIVLNYYNHHDDETSLKLLLEILVIPIHIVGKERSNNRNT